MKTNYTRGRLLGLLNRLFVKVQRKVQGIPWGAAHIYDKVAAKYLEPSYDYVIDEVSQVSTYRIVDVGCGPGKLLLSLARRSLGTTLVGIDISSAMAYIAHKNSLKEELDHSVDFVVADAHLIPIRDDSIDLILSTGTLHHIKNPEKLFKELKRVLRRGGEAWIYEFSHDAPWKEVKDVAKTLKRPTLLLKLAATLHGLPRKTFDSGYIRNSLVMFNVTYSVLYKGVITKLVIKGNDNLKNSSQVQTKTN